ncbi:hypothetical protein KEM55_002212 [Ascosphaera atra]|nr:hypothetical protein KEM55_002212 [Ascosphaera atra]
MDVHFSGYQSDRDVDGVQGNVQTLNVPSSYGSQNHTLGLSEDESGDDGLMLGSDHLQPKRLVGHRLQASRSVLSLAIDEECVYAGLQGGEILPFK